MEKESKFVDAIEEGKIVKVSEFYAKREGLPILRKSTTIQTQSVPLRARPEREAQPRSRSDLYDYLKKPADWKEKQVLSELVENFHWRIRMERRKKGVTKKQLAQMIGEKEEVIRTIEYGRLPTKDFVLINKIQKALGINLRKDGKTFDTSVKKLLDENPKTTKDKSLPSQDDSDIGIQVLDEEV